MSSRIRVLLAACLALSLAVPIPAAALARTPDPSESTARKSVSSELAGKAERPLRGQATGRKSDPFGQKSRGDERPKVPTSITPRIDPPSAGPADRSQSIAEGVLVDTPTSAFFLDGSAASGPGSGLLKLYTAADTTISVITDSPSELTFSVFENPYPNADWWYVWLKAPSGQPLAPGTYEGAVRACCGGPDEPGLDFYGNGVGCNEVTGRFVIHELTRGGGGELTSLAASFEHHCEGGPDAAFGELRFNSAMPLGAFAFDPPSVSYGTVSVGQAHGRAVEISNTGGTPLGLAGFSTTGSDAAMFTVSQESCPSSLPPGDACAVTVDFEPTALGPRNAALVIDDDTARGAHRVPLQGQATNPGIAGSSGRAPAEILPIGNGITDAMHQDFYTCSTVPCIEPPDPAIAVGPDHVVQSAGALIRVTNRLGGAALTSDIGSWFAQPDDIDGFADVTVAYHAGTDRYFGASSSWYCGSDPVGYLDVGVSMTSDPAGEWWIYSFEFPDSVPTSPLIGLTSDKVAVSNIEVNIADVCGGSPNPGFLGSSLTILDTNDAVSLLSTIYYAGTAADPEIRAWRPASSPTSATGTLHLVAAIGGSSGVDIGYATVVGQVTPPTMHIAQFTDLTTDGVVPATAQGGPPVDPGGSVGSVSNALPGAAAWHDGKLAFAVDHPCVPTDDTETRLCVRVVELATPTDPAAKPTLRQDVMLSEKGAYLYQGGVAYSVSGDLHVVNAVSSGSKPIGIRHVYRRADDPAGAFSNVATVITGKAAYTGDAWGDVVVLAQDPVDAFAIWQGHEYASVDGSWRTRVTQVRLPGATFHPMDPKRLLDTRSGNGLSGTFLANTPRTFQVTGRAGIPAKAIAVTGNLSVTGQTKAGYVALTPTPTSAPSTSTVNFPLGDTRGNNVTLSLGAGGKMSAVYKAPAGARTHLIFDVTGYFVRDNTGSTYFPLGPVRLLNSRAGNGLTGPFHANTPRTWQITGRGGVPAGAKAISANLAVIDQTGAGYVALTPTPTADPPTSTINFPIGDVRANGVTVPLAPDGTLSAVFKAAPGKTTNLVLDVTGYYVADLTGARFVPLNPARTLDSRFNVGLNGTFKSSTPRTLVIDGRRGIPNDADAITGNLTIVGQTGGGFVSITLAPTATPSTSTLNAPVGDVRGNGVTVGIAANGTDSLTYVSAGGKVAHLILDLTGYFR